MGFNMHYIFAALLLVSVRASRYDQGPQKFYEVSSDSETAEQNENREVVLYLTPEQVRSLEENGAVVRSSEEPENNEADPGLPEPQVTEEQPEEAEQEEDEEAQQEEEEAQQEEQESPEDSQNQDIDFEEILKILNEQVDEEETEEAAEEQASNEPQIEEENTESPRNFSPRITLRQPQQQQQQQPKYVAPVVAKKDQILKSYSYIRYQPNEQPQQINVQLLQQQQQEADEAEAANEEPETESTNQERKKYKLIPYEVEETTEPAQEENSEEQTQQNTQVDSAQIDTERINEAIRQRNNKLLQNEVRLQNILRELKSSPKRNDQKYAIEIERLRADLLKQNTLSKAEKITKVTPAMIMQQINKKHRLNKSSKQGKVSARGAEAQQGKPQQTKFRKTSAPAENARPIRVPVIKAEKTESPRPIPVPVETGKRLSVKNVYVRTRTEKPFIVSRKAAESKRQRSVEVPKSKPERITILRHIWDY